MVKFRWTGHISFSRWTQLPQFTVIWWYVNIKYIFDIFTFWVGVGGKDPPVERRHPKALDEWMHSSNAFHAGIVWSSLATGPIKLRRLRRMIVPMSSRPVTEEMYALVTKLSHRTYVPTNATIPWLWLMCLGAMCLGARVNGRCLHGFSFIIFQTL